ncbi:MAG: hypothetical protein ACI8XB_002705, partial [Patiriisocius sp.]
MKAPIQPSTNIMKYLISNFDNLIVIAFLIFFSLVSSDAISKATYAEEGPSRSTSTLFEVNYELEDDMTCFRYAGAGSMSQGTGDPSCGIIGNLIKFDEELNVGDDWNSVKYYIETDDDACCGTIDFSFKAGSLSSGGGCFYAEIIGPDVPLNGSGNCTPVSGGKWGGTCSNDNCGPDEAEYAFVYTGNGCDANYKVRFYGYYHDVPNGKKYWYYKVKTKKVTGNGPCFDKDISHVNFQYGDCADCAPSCMLDYDCLLTDFDGDCAIPSAETNLNDIFSINDNCGKNLDFRIEENGDNELCQVDGTPACFVRSYILFDANDPSETELGRCDQSIIVVDDEAPHLSPSNSSRPEIVEDYDNGTTSGEFSPNPPNLVVVIPCGDPLLPITNSKVKSWFDVSDNCSPDLNVQISDSPQGGLDCEADQIKERYVCTLYSTDACGNTSSVVIDIQVKDTEPPVIVCPDDYAFECVVGDLTATGTATASDNCDANPVITSSDVNATPDSCGLYVITRTWTATDECGNSSSCDQIITIQDTIDPIISCPAGITFECDNIDYSLLDPPTGTDNCDPNPLIVYVDTPNLDECGLGVIYRVSTVTDCSGNSSSSGTVITIVDTTPPVITCPANVTYDCEEGSTSGEATATDNCSIPTITSSDANNLDDCGYGTITRTWTATDCSGLSSSCDQIITIEDNTPPVIVCPANVSLECPDSTEPGAGCDDDFENKLLTNESEFSGSETLIDFEELGTSDLDLT